MLQVGVNQCFNNVSRGQSFTDVLSDKPLYRILFMRCFGALGLVPPEDGRVGRPSSYPA